MADTVRIVWNGSSSFSPGDTPWGFYDYDYQFQLDADSFAKFAAVRLGYGITDIELNSGSFYAALEEAITTYGNEIYSAKVKDNYLSLEGITTGSNLNNTVITPSLGGLIRIAETYGSEAGVGGYTTYYTGSLPLISNQQNYNLNTWASASASLTPGDSIEIKRIFYQGSPAITRFFDPFASTGTGFQSLMESFGFGGMSPGVSFMLMPIYFDLEKIQAIEFNDQIRKSAYSFDLVNNQLRVFPIPALDGFNLFFHYIKRSERDSPISPYYSGSNLITNPSNVPFRNPIYSQINSIGKQWIMQYALAIAKEMLGYVRGKYSTIPIPGAEVTLNGSTLVSDALAMKKDLLEHLRGMLDETGRTKQMEKKKDEAQSHQDIMNKIPMTFYIG